MQYEKSNDFNMTVICRFLFKFENKKLDSVADPYTGRHQLVIKEGELVKDFFARYEGVRHVQIKSHFLS